MVDVPQDVDGSLLSDRQVAVLARRIDGEGHESIAAALDTTPEGVRTLESAAREQVDAAYETVRIVEALRSDVRVEAEAGMRVLDVVRQLRSAGDRIGVKLGTTEETLHETLERLLDDALDGNRLATDVTLAIDNDGQIGVAESGAGEPDRDAAVSEESSD